MATTTNEREIAAGIVRAVADNASSIVTAISPDPGVAAAVAGAKVGFGLLATIIEKFGTDKTNEILAELAEHPATEISDAELEEDVQAVLRKHGVAPRKK